MRSTAMPYIVAYRKSVVFTDLVYANSKGEAIRLSKHGVGNRLGFEIDETKYPTSYTADKE